MRIAVLRPSRVCAESEEERTKSHKKKERCHGVWRFGYSTPFHVQRPGEYNMAFLFLGGGGKKLVDAENASLSVCFPFDNADV